MPIPITCACGEQFDVQDRFGGRQVRCPCGRVLTVPAAATGLRAEAPPAGPPAPVPFPDGVARPNSPAPPARASVLPWVIAGASLFVMLLLAVVLVGVLAFWRAATPEAQNTPAGGNGAERPAPQSPPPAPPAAPEESPTPRPDASPSGGPPASPPPAEPSPPAPPGRAPGTPLELVSLARTDKLTVPVEPISEKPPPPPALWPGHAAMIRGIAFSSDGRYALSASGDINDHKVRGLGEPDNSVRLWDARRGKQLRMLKGLNPDYSYPMEKTVFERGLSDCISDTSAASNGRTSGTRCEGGERPIGKALIGRAGRAPGRCRASEGPAGR